MLSDYLYNLCRFITSNFQHINTKNISPFSSFMDFNLYENILTKNNFNYIWMEKLHHKHTNSTFKYKYEILEQHYDLLKIKLTISNSFLINFNDKSIKSSSIDEYLLIIEYTKSSLLNALILISREENELNYDNYLNKNLSSVSNLDLRILTYDNITLWNGKIKNINELYDCFINKSSYNRFSTSKFNINNACKYAEKYALTPNDNYRNFNDSGGDCTNFISQIIHAGGIPLTNTWKPYTSSWIRVNELYKYITKNNIGKKLPDDSPYIKGSIIQFYTPQKGYYFHSGFITYVLPFNQALYCCHSYNKLNYPLSEIYPVIYPVIRCITLN
ncbi:MAG TPA: hypothetical protein DG753_01010 [Clostridium sp.]|nr:hypothetical protein [Clostridium sp.]